MRSHFHLTAARLVLLSGISLAVVLWWWAWPLGRAYHLAGTGTWPEKNNSVRELDCLYAVLRNRSIVETGPAIIRCLADRRPFAYYNGTKGEHSWQYPRLSSRHERAYYLAEELWRDANSRESRQALVSALPALLRTATSSSQRRFISYALLNRWNPEAQTDLIRIASDLNENIDTQAAAAAVLMRHGDTHRHVATAIEIIHRGGTADWPSRSPRRPLSPTQRKLHLFHSMFSSGQVELLQPDDRTQLIQVGMSLLRELPEIDLRSGYFVAGVLGRMANAPDNFSPPQRDYLIKNGGGLQEAFFTDTVKNALAWQAK